MIKVIKHKPKFYFTKCHKCDCEFQYELEDLKFNAMHVGLTVECPECKAEIFHHDRDRIYKEG